MAHGVKPQKSALSLKVEQGGANPQMRKQGRINARSLVSQTRRNPLLNLVPKVEQRWSKVEQQGGQCSTHREPLKGFPWWEVEQAPGRFAGVEHPTGGSMTTRRNERSRYARNQARREAA